MREALGKKTGYIAHVPVSNEKKQTFQKNKQTNKHICEDTKLCPTCCKFAKFDIISTTAAGRIANHCPKQTMRIRTDICG